MHKASTLIQSRSTNTPQHGIQYFIQWHMNRKSRSITYRLSHCLKSFGLFSPATEEGKKQYNWHRYARTENQHTLVIRMCSLRCRRRLVEGHPSSQSTLSPKCASPTWSYAACTNAHMYLSHLAQICCIPPHLSMWPLTGWQTACAQSAHSLYYKEAQTLAISLSHKKCMSAIMKHVATSMFQEYTSELGLNN